jgi:hypothetical protein
MKLRHKRKQFWWTWRYAHYDFEWGVGRILHQLKDRT